MVTRLAVYVNSDDALLIWTADELDDRCKGFAIRRELTRAGATSEGWVNNYAGFGPEEHQNGTYFPSDQYPFRTFSWTDHEVGPGDEVRYRAVPVLEGAPAPSEELASEWSDTRALDASAAAPYAAYFNRGYVISQFMSRYLDEHYPGEDRDKALRDFKRDIHDHLEQEVRDFLSGQVRTTMLSLLADVERSNDHLYAALFELDDTQLVDALKSLGQRAHIVLANGSITKADDETTDEARKRDENEEARDTLRSAPANVDVSKVDRFVSPGALAHNKFAVVADADGVALRVWTGSTNWTTTGLCTQLNNGLLVDDRDVAGAYLEQWKALCKAKSEHPPSLSAANVTATDVGGNEVGTVRASVHFTRAQGGADLDALRGIVDGANEGVLFLMFMPGDQGVLSYVRDLAAHKSDLVVRGVVSELPKGRTDEKTGTTTTLKVSLVGTSTEGAAEPETFEVVQPEGMDHPAAGWAVETTHAQFKSDIGWAIVHSKVLVVDPFSSDPTVVTGSHNFSLNASGENDENFIVVRGNRPLAEAYAVNVDSAWRHYAGRVAKSHPDKTGIDYLRALLADQQRERAFWGLQA